jgi:hypothetical protein
MESPSVLALSRPAGPGSAGLTETRDILREIGERPSVAVVSTGSANGAEKASCGLVAVVALIVGGAMRAIEPPLDGAGHLGTIVARLSHLTHVLDDVAQAATEGHDVVAQGRNGASALLLDEFLVEVVKDVRLLRVLAMVLRSR